jgi:hypothetical protein
MLVPIEIDFDIHKAIVNEQRTFDEAPYLALRRLLKLPDPGTDPEDQATSNSGRSWQQQGVEIAHGSPARMSYLRGTQVFEGKFLDGKLVVNGRAFASLSEAASKLARTGNGTRTQLDGWKYWETKVPAEDKWVSLRELRRRARKTAGLSR